MYFLSGEPMHYLSGVDTATVTGHTLLTSGRLYGRWGGPSSAIGRLRAVGGGFG